MDEDGTITATSADPVELVLFVAGIHDRLQHLAANKNFSAAQLRAELGEMARWVEAWCHDVAGLLNEQRKGT